MLLEKSTTTALPERGLATRSFFTFFTVITLAVLTGCVSQAQKEPGTTVGASATSQESSPTSSGSPTQTGGVEGTDPGAAARVNPQKPKAPAGLNSHDIDGAVLSAKHFLDLYNYTIESGDPEDFKATYSEKCTFCTAATKRALDDSTAGRQQIGGIITYDDAQLTDNIDVSREVSILFDVTEAALSVYSPSKELLETAPSGALLLQIDLVHVSSKWQVEAIKGDEVD